MRRTTSLLRQPRRLLAILTAIAMLSTAFAPGVGAQEDPIAGPGARLAEGLRSWVSVLSARGYAPELEARLPLTRRDVRDVLDLPTLLAAELTPVLGQGIVDDSSLDGLIDAVGAASDASEAGTYVLTVADGAAGTKDVGLRVEVVRDVDVPVSYREVEYLDDAGNMLTLEEIAGLDSDAVLAEDTVLELQGGAGAGSIAVTVTAVFDTSFTFVDDTGGPVPGGRLVVDELTEGVVQATGSADPLELAGRVGVTEVTASGSLAFDRRWELEAVDPDGTGGLSIDDWQVSLPDAVLPISTVDTAAPTVDLDLDLEAWQTPASPDGSVTWSVEDPLDEGAPASPTTTLGDELERFRQVTPSDLLSGFTELGALVATAEASADVEVPFTDVTVADLVGARDVVLDAVQRQGAALVLCGRTDSSPPVGAELAGTTWYCQAYTQGEPEAGSIAWSVADDGAAISTDPADFTGTIGVDPDATVAVTDVETVPRVTVSWTDEATGAQLQANRRFTTFRELAAALQADLVATPGVDAATVDVGELVGDAVPVSVSLTMGEIVVDAAFAAGNDLGSVGFQGIEPVPGAVEVTVDGVELDAALEVSLVDRSYDPTDEPDRFHLTAIDQPLLTVGSVSSAVDDPVSLLGRVGYLRATGTATGFDASTVGDGPAIEVRVLGADASDQGPVALADALRDPVARLSATHAIAMADGSVTVAAASADGNDLLPAGSPTATVSWTDVAPGSAPTVAPDAAWTSGVVPFDVTPEVSGTVTADDLDGIVLTDTDADFTTAFGAGVSVGDVIVAQLFNTTTQAVCSRFEITSTTTLTCITEVEGDPSEPGLQGGTARIDPITGVAEEPAAGDPDGDELGDDWRVGDRYSVSGDVTALGGIVTEGLVDVIKRLAQVEDEGLTDSLALISLTPRQLLPQLDELEALLSASIPRIAPDGGSDQSRTALAYLDELEAALEAEGAAVSFEMRDLVTRNSAQPIPHLVATMEETESGVLEGDLAPTLQAALAPAAGDETGGDVLFGTDPAEASAPAAATPRAEWSSTVTLSIGVPIDGGVDPSEVLVLGGTGVSDLTVTIGSETLDLAGRFGSLPVDLGTDAVLQGTLEATTGTHTGGPVATGVTIDAVPDPDPGDSDVVTESTSEFDTASDLTDVAEGDVVVTDQDAWCTIDDIGTAGGGSDAQTISCVDELTDNGTFVVGGAVEVFQALEVTTADPIPDAVDDTRTLVHVPSGASCEIAATTETTITCDDPLSGGTGLPAWDAGDGWSVSLSSASVLDVPGAAFDTFGLREGVDVVRKLNGAGAVVASCTIGTVEPDALACEDVLSEGEWSDGDTWEIGGVGEAALEVAYALTHSEDAPLDVPEGDGGGYFGLIKGGVTGTGTDATCGSGVGLACLRLSALAAPGTPDEAFVGFVEVTVAEGEDPTTALAPAARDAVAAGMLDLSLLGTALPFLPPVLEDALDGAIGDDELLLPLVGGDLGAGAQVVEAVDALGLSLLDLAPADIAALETQVATRLGEALLPDGVAVSGATVTCDGAACDPDAGLDAVEEVEVAFTVSENLEDASAAPTYGCPDTDCATTANGTAAFDSGLPALLIEANGSEPVDLEATRGWWFPVVIGVDKATGPYLDVSGNEDLVVAAAVTIPEVPEAELGDRCANSPGDMAPSTELFGTVPTPDTDAADYDSSVSAANPSLRCFDAGIGYLEGTFYDGATDLGPITDLAGTEAAEGALTERSRLDLRTAIDLDGTGGTLSVLQMIDRDETVTRNVEARGNVDLYVVTGRTTELRGEIPSVHTSLHWAFTTDDTTGSALTGEVQYLDIVIDLRSFLDDLVGPWAGDALSYLSVLRPVADLLLTPIPGLTHVAEAMGNPPVTLFALIQETTGQDLSLVYALLEFLLFADQVNAGLSSSVNPDDGYAGLNGPAADPNCDVGGESSGNSPCGLSTEGGFKLAQEKGRESGPCGQAVVKGKKTKVTQDCTKRKRSHTISPSNLGTSSTRETITQLKPCSEATKPCTNKEPVRAMSKQLGVNLSTPGLAFPFLTDPTEMYGMLLGDSDAELIRLDLGTLAVNFGLEYKWGPFMAGPVPISIGIGLGIDLELRAMLGIDTLGLRTTGVLGDGFFINDLDPLSIGSDGNPRDVPELKLTFTVSLTAGISIGFFTAGVKGTIQFILGADLNDPNGDGRIRPAELAQFNGRPECALILTGDLRVIISIFVELDFKIWSKEWVYDLFQRTWRLFELKCEPEAPALAEVVGDDDDVVLLAGSLAQREKRNIEEDETDETFTVRVSDPASTTDPRTVTVEAFGLVLDYELGPNGKIIANMGDGNDNLVFGDGTDENGDEVPFDIDSLVTLGDGNDAFEGGDGVDDVDGGAGNDNIVGGPDNDVLKGADGNDTIDGGQGDDTITGGAGDDRLSGAQGADVVDGGDGDDRIQGGPGMASSQAQRIAGLQVQAQGLDPAAADLLAMSMFDGADVLIGGPGDDDIAGHFGADRIVGSSVTGTVTAATGLDELCAAATGEDGDDTIDGGPGDDVLAGGAGDDQITGLRGDDQLCGGKGNDTLRGDGQDAPGTDGDDILRGDAGDDILEAGGGDDIADGGEGNDLVDGDAGDDIVAGGPGTDLVDGGDGDDTLDGDERQGQPIATPVDGAIAVCDVAASVEDGRVVLPGTYAAPTVIRVAGHRYIQGIPPEDSGLDLNRDDTVDELDVGLVGDIVVIDGAFDVDGNGTIDAADDGLVPVPVLVGSGDADCVRGGPGNDTARGGAGDDLLLGGDGYDDLSGGIGDDTVRGGAGADDIFGDDGDDTLFGDSGPDVIDGGTGDDRLHGGGAGDHLIGGPGSDALFGEESSDLLIGGSRGAPGTEDAGDVLYGGPGGDTLIGDNATADDHVDDLSSTPGGPGGDDVLDGGAGSDVLYGGNGNDTLYGDGPDRRDSPGGDTLEGNSGDDTLYGDEDDDTLIGGTSDDAVAGGDASGLADGDDDLFGGTGADLLIGDNGNRDGTVLDLPIGDALSPADAGGEDQLEGEFGNDVLLGGLFDDDLLGGSGDDVAEGNHGDDAISGGAGDDKLLGGTSDDAVASGDASGLADVGDTIDGGEGDDLVIGDNGRRTGIVLDAPLAGDAAAAAGGEDTIDGGTGDDTLLGGLAGDALSGGDGADVIEGNHGDDTIAGDAGDDTLLGGTSDDAADGGDASGLADGADGIDAGAGDDVVVGDNGTRDGEPHDLPRGGQQTTPGTGGGDQILGGDGRDTIRAGVGDDTVRAGDGDDLVEGNTDADQLHGEGGDDVLIGGTDQADHTDHGDVVLGGDGTDVVLGDNGLVDGDGITLLLDVQLADGEEPGAVSGDDVLDGGAEDDRIHGQGGDDLIAGGPGDDLVEGNHGGDTIAGGSGTDAIAGGGSAADGIQDDERVGDGLLDGDDTIHGDGTDTVVTETDDGPAALTAAAFVGTWSSPSGVVDGPDVIGGDNIAIDPEAPTRLFDVQLVGGSVGDGTSGGDTIFGGGADDRLHGQGGDDRVYGEDGVDLIEGNHGDDTVYGGLGDDDVAGGGSARDGVLDDDRDPSGLVDGQDTLVGDLDEEGGSTAEDGDDVLAGDNAWISRVSAEGDPLTELEVAVPARFIQQRRVVMNDVGPGATSGSDLLYGNGGQDDLYGQFDDTPEAPDAEPQRFDAVCGERTIADVVGDFLCAGDGDDGLLGDQGTMALRLAEDVADQTDITTAGNFLTARVFETGTLIRQVELTQDRLGGDDVLLGGAGSDAVHTGAGDDLADGGDGEDVLFGHDGDDALWGGADHDRLYGGFGADHLDVKPRSSGRVIDPPRWFEVAPEVDTDGIRATTNGIDIHYGGEDADAMQADVVSNGPADGDRLFDWFGAYNINYVCASTNGAAVYSRGPAPATIAFLQDLASGDGLVALDDRGSVGSRSLAVVTSGNKNPRHPDTPGNFTCEGD